MKKILKIVIFLSLMFVFATLFSNAHAALIGDLSTLSTTTDKTTVHPDQNITLKIDMGQPLGAYTFDVDFDDALLDYESATGGTASAVGDHVTLTFYDSTGGNNPSSTATITFKAKGASVITSTNPTEFSITATGLANPDGTDTFDDITVPIVKDFVVEPAYVDYTIGIEYTEPLKKEIENAINVTIKSTEGRNYDHLRIIAEATKPTDATIQLMRNR